MEMTKEEIQKAVDLMKPIYDIEKPIQELMGGHYSLCSYAYKMTKELAKHKRAFEIIKKHKMIYDLTDFELSQEEHELMEELMKNER